MKTFDTTDVEVLKCVLFNFFRFYKVGSPVYPIGVTSEPSLRRKRHTNGTDWSTWVRRRSYGSATWPTWSHGLPWRPKQTCRRKVPPTERNFQVHSRFLNHWLRYLGSSKTVCHPCIIHKNSTDLHSGVLPLVVHLPSSHSTEPFSQLRLLLYDSFICSCVTVRLLLCRTSSKVGLLTLVISNSVTSFKDDLLLYSRPGILG